MHASICNSKSMSFFFWYIDLDNYCENHHPQNGIGPSTTWWHNMQNQEAMRLRKQWVPQY